MKGLTETLDDGTKGQVFAELRQALADHVTTDGVLLGAGTWLITANQAT